MASARVFWREATRLFLLKRNVWPRSVRWDREAEDLREEYKKNVPSSVKSNNSYARQIMQLPHTRVAQKSEKVWTESDWIRNV